MNCGYAAESTSCAVPNHGSVPVNFRYDFGSLGGCAGVGTAGRRTGGAEFRVPGGRSGHARQDPVPRGCGWRQHDVLPALDGIQGAAPGTSGRRAMRRTGRIRYGSWRSLRGEAVHAAVLADPLAAGPAVSRCTDPRTDTTPREASGAATVHQSRTRETERGRSRRLRPQNDAPNHPIQQHAKPQAPQQRTHPALAKPTAADPGASGRRTMHRTTRSNSTQSLRHRSSTPVHTGGIQCGLVGQRVQQRGGLGQ